VRLVGEDGKQIGVIKTSDALAYAQERDLDLVEVAPDARPPVCRVLDYSKYKYEQAQKQKAARKHQQQITIREIKFRPKIAQNDYDTKKGHIERFLRGKDKVKVTIMFRGREVTHPERGVALLDRLAGELSEISVVEQTPLQDGRNMTMMLAPSKAIMAEVKDGQEEREQHEPKRRQHHHEAKAAARDEAPATNNQAAARDEAPATNNQAAAPDEAPATNTESSAAPNPATNGSATPAAATDEAPRAASSATASDAAA